MGGGDTESQSGLDDGGAPGGPGAPTPLSVLEVCTIFQLYLALNALTLSEAVLFTQLFSKGEPSTDLDCLVNAMADLGGLL